MVVRWVHIPKDKDKKLAFNKSVPSSNNFQPPNFNLLGSFFFLGAIIIMQTKEVVGMDYYIW